jgi:hypothetical protein
MKSIVHIYIDYTYARQITEEWGELNINWHLEAFGAFYTPFWAAYGLSDICVLFCHSLSFTKTTIPRYFAFFPLKYPHLLNK